MEKNQASGSPNCGQLVINNGGGLVTINSTCCRQGWIPYHDLEENKKDLKIDSPDNLKKWPLWAKEEV